VEPLQDRELAGVWAWPWTAVPKSNPALLSPKYRHICGYQRIALDGGAQQYSSDRSKPRDMLKFSVALTPDMEAHLTAIRGIKMSESVGNDLLTIEQNDIILRDCPRRGTLEYLLHICGFMGENPQTFLAARLVIAQLLRLLAPFHARGLVFRTVNPRNLDMMFDEAHIYLGNPLDMFVPGAPMPPPCEKDGFMPPEDEVTPAWDVWSVGVLFAYLLTGRMPTECESLYDFYASLNGRLSPKGATAEQDRLTRDVISACLSPNPADRPSVRQLLAHKLFLGNGLGPIVGWLRGVSASAFAKELVYPQIGEYERTLGLLTFMAFMEDDTALRWSFPLPTDSAREVLPLVFQRCVSTLSRHALDCLEF
jgi:hypothetical protein